MKLLVKVTDECTISSFVFIVTTFRRDAGDKLSNGSRKAAELITPSWQLKGANAILITSVIRIEGVC